MRFHLITALSALGALTGVAQAAGLDCVDLSGAELNVSSVTVTAVSRVAAGEEFGRSHCLIEATTAERIGTDGAHYGIRFELRLPDEWSRDFVHQFNGGNDGSVSPAVGSLMGGNASDTALSRGYAVVSSNAGHDGDAFPEAGLAGGARFGFDAQARRDYGFNAVATLHPLAISMVEAYYGQDIEHIYGVGGSNGGRHAMVAAARMPEAFDGLLIGYPGYNLPRAAVQHAWDVQAFKAVNGDVRTAFSREDLTHVASTILASCDGLDGLADGVIADVDGCQSRFDPDILVCEPGRDECLSASQVAALKAVHAGPRNSQGVPLYSDWAWDAGIGSGDWRFWKLESPIPPWNKQPLIAVMGAASLAQLFTTPPIRVEGTPDALERYLLDFDFDRDAPKIYATTEAFPESAMDYMTPPGSDDPALAEFRGNGGKLIVFHGVSDPVFSVNDTTDWYRKLDANNDDNAEDFARYYRIPGMPHGAGGPATDDFDFFTPLVQWVERNEAPGAVMAGVTQGNQEGRRVLGDITRKLCPYPRVARYVGEDPSEAGSFECR